ncbi:MAG: protein kinase [Archangium sp.]|nr:protein kinase [Archangium sp.]
MGTYRLAKHLTSPSLLTDSWAGVSDAGKPVLVLRRKDPWAQQPQFFERFAATQRGWQALRQADGVLPLVEVGQADGSICVVQSFLESEPLRLAMSGAAPPGRTPFSVVESVAVVLQAARGLLSLEQLDPSVMHGDVSASTLLLGSDGSVRFEAIGMASAHQANDSLGPARSELLTLSPEELDGPAAATSDVFRLGLVWLELLTGKPAFSGSSWAEVKARFARFPGVTPGHFTALPQPIPMVLAMMLSRLPSSRPAVSDLELMLTQVYGAVGGIDSPVTPLADAFVRLFPSRSNVGAQLQGGTVLNLSPLGGAAEGAVKLARINTKRMTATDVAQSRALQAQDAARAVAREWTLQHSRDEGNPRDLALGAALLEQQRLTREQVDAALQHAQSLSATFFDSVCALDVLDEDEVLPIAAGLLKQQYLTGPQLLELELGPAQEQLLARDVADDWQIIPLKLEAGALTVAVMDPSRVDVLDDVKIRAKARSVIPVRATERTIQEGFSRIYDGKTAAPEWAVKRAPSPPPVALSDEPLIGLPLASSNSGVLELIAPIDSSPGVEAPRSVPPPIALGPPLAASELVGSLEVSSRLFDALLSVVGDRGLEASAMISLVRSVAKQAGAVGAPLDQVRLSVTAVVIAALLEGKRGFEVPSRPAAAACLGPHWRDFEDFVRPLLDGHETLPSDPRGVVLCMCFEVADRIGCVPTTLAEVGLTLEHLRSRYPLAALAALEIVLAGK